MKTLIVSKTALTVATVAFGAALSLPAAIIDFSTDPNIAGDWENNTFITGIGTGTATWDGTNGDLDLQAAAGATYWSALSPTGATLGANETVTMDVKSATGTPGNNPTAFGLVGLTISTSGTPTIGSGAHYTFRHTSTSLTAGLWSYEVIDHAGVSLYISDTPASFTPVTMQIRRSGDEFDFMANGSTLFTSSGTYTAAQNDAMVNYHIAFSSGNTALLNATVDNFGVIPEPGTYALLGGLFALSFVMVRRRR